MVSSYQTVQSLAIGYAHKTGCSEKDMEELAEAEASMSEQALFLKVSFGHVRGWSENVGVAGCEGVWGQVWLCVCMCMYVCVCVYICVHVCMCVYVCVCVCMCVCMCVYVCACVYVCVHVCMMCVICAY